MGVIRGTKLYNISVYGEDTSEVVLTKIFHRRVHLRHTDNIGDSALCRNDTAQRIRVLLTQLLEKHQAELAKQLVFAALFDDNRQPRGQIGCLLTNLGALVVETPQDSGDDLRQVRLDANT